MLICGIDPGFGGAIAFLNSETRELRVEDMPVAPAAKGRDELNLYRLGTLLTPPDGEERPLAMLEYVAARPGQGAPSVFRFGQGYGAIQMALTCHGWERHCVTPAVWKKHFKLSTDKGVSRSLATSRFPKYGTLFQRVKDDGRAEAALLALYALEKLI